MTPQEKAKELVDKFTLVGLQQRNEGIQCAIICVDEILKNFGNLTDGKQHYCSYEAIEYYQEVIEEIEQL
tara:strand:+ start:323 stop:532 length:210 start_codon:yes stop_codon:yes gene_type:complete